MRMWKSSDDSYFFSFSVKVQFSFLEKIRSLWLGNRKWTLSPYADLPCCNHLSNHPSKFKLTGLESLNASLVWVYLLMNTSDVSVICSVFFFFSNSLIPILFLLKFKNILNSKICFKACKIIWKNIALNE